MTGFANVHFRLSDRLPQPHPPPKARSHYAETFNGAVDFANDGQAQTAIALGNRPTLSVKGVNVQVFCIASVASSLKPGMALFFAR
jgi:hypothetical protein